MCLGVFLLGFILYGTVCLLGLIDYFLFHVGEIFNYNLFKNFLIPFLFLFFFWDPYNSNVGVFDSSDSDILLLIPSTEEKKKGYKKFFEEIIVENFPNMEKEIVNQI